MIRLGSMRQSNCRSGSSSLLGFWEEVGKLSDCAGGVLMPSLELSIEGTASDDNVRDLSLHKRIAQ